MTNDKTIGIGLLLYPGVQMSAVLSMTDLFLIVERVSPGAQLQVSHWQQEEGEAAPVRVFQSGGSSPSAPAVIILPPSLTQPPSPDTAAPLRDWLNQRHAEGTILASVCAGAFVLAETGLLKGRPATTHWSYADAFRVRFPDVRMEIDRLLIDDGPVVTAGGLMSWTDLCLRLVERLCGPEVMVRAARFLLLDPPGREQRYYSTFAPRTSHGDAQIAKVQDLLHAAEGRDVPLEVLISASGLERRTFLRRFRKATGMTSSEYIQRLRIRKACELLQFRRDPIEQVAWDSGYADPAAFRRVFARFIGLTPGEYRRRFATSGSQVHKFTDYERLA
ncbi:GlxA family transcriptional regulator [Falsirhodobacter sp. 1013]|uniref:GlxA family transcriptional regulator n=1 Tax=Falsirhodobacter sp. 1013 TaxID=3417566 RepID=UPI003EBB0E46